LTALLARLRDKENAAHGPGHDGQVTEAADDAVHLDEQRAPAVVALDESVAGDVLLAATLQLRDAVQNDGLKVVLGLREPLIHLPHCRPTGHGDVAEVPRAVVPGRRTLGGVPVPLAQRRTRPEAALPDELPRALRVDDEEWQRGGRREGRLARLAGAVDEHRQNVTLLFSHSIPPIASLM